MREWTEITPYNTCRPAYKQALSYQTLWSCDPPLADGTTHVVVSSVCTGFTQETLVFRTNSIGTIQSFEDIGGCGFTQPSPKELLYNGADK